MVERYEGESGAEFLKRLERIIKRKGRSWDLHTEFLRVAESGNGEILAAFIDGGVDVNYQRPLTGQTALHIGAACGARDVVRELVASNKCNYLLRDYKGRLTSEMAFLYGRDVPMSRLLGIKERKAAESEGIKLTRRPRLEAKPA